MLAATSIWLVCRLADKMRRKSLTLQNTIITFPLVNDTGTAGVQKWRYGTGGQIGWSSPAIGPDGAVYFGSLDHKIYAIETNCGGLPPPWRRKWNGVSRKWNLSLGQMVAFPERRRLRFS